MTTPGAVQALGLSFNAWQPVIVVGTSYIAKGAHVPFAFDTVDRYEHVLEAVGGYWSASLTMSVSRGQLEDWLYRGLNRHVEVTDQALDVIWEGFVNSVSVTVGGMTVTRGPMLEVANRIAMTYSTVDTSTSPPTVGVRTTTDWAEDSASQSLYGTLETMLSTGGATATTAEQMRDTYLGDNASPKHKQSLTFPPSAESSVIIECLGYIHKLRSYVYNQTASTGVYNLSTKLAEILAAHPDALFGTGSITSNTLQIKRWENDDAVAWGLVKSLTEIGDASDNRYTFGVYGDRQPRYAQVPSDVDYSYSVYDPEQGIMSRYAGLVKPWNVLPARWLEFTDLLTDQRAAVSLRSDPRMMFIESIRYATPWNLTINGSRIDTISQQMARLGLSGIGGL